MLYHKFEENLNQTIINAAPIKRATNRPAKVPNHILLARAFFTTGWSENELLRKARRTETTMAASVASRKRATKTGSENPKVGAADIYLLFYPYLSLSLTILKNLSFSDCTAANEKISRPLQF
jgi:hypothetical protein